MGGEVQIILQMLESIERRVQGIEDRLNQDSRGFVSKELFNNLVAEVAELSEDFGKLKKELHGKNLLEERRGGQRDIIEKLAWPVVVTLVGSFSAWLGLGK